MKDLVLIAALGLGLTTLGGCGDYDRLQAKRAEAIAAEDYARELAQEFNRRIESIPSSPDVEVTQISAQGRTIIYHVRLSEAWLGEESAVLFNARMRVGLVQKVCADPGVVEEILGRGIFFRYDYYTDPDGSRFTSIEVNRSDCAQNPSGQ